MLKGVVVRNGELWRGGKRLWTPMEDARLRELYPDLRTDIVAALVQRPLSSTYQRALALGLRKSTAYCASIDACRLRRDSSVGIPFRFKKGQVPANKGLRRPGWHRGRMRETQFKKGERRGAANTNWRPVGTILEDTDGYLRIKVREGRPGEATGFGNSKAWPMLHRHVWAQAHGPIPKNHAVCFKDGNRQHCALDNLELVTRQELMRRNTIHHLPPELAHTIQLLGALNRQIRKREGTHAEKQDRRSA